jgi:hypothetical protein
LSRANRLLPLFPYTVRKLVETRICYSFICLPGITNINILSAACCSEHFLVFHWHACEHLIAGTERSNSFCRTEKLSWRLQGGSSSLPLHLAALGEHPICLVYVVL